MTKMHAKLKQYLKFLKKIVFFNKTCTFVRPGDARVTWRNAFDLHVEKYSGKNYDCGERPLLCIFRHFGGLYLLKER